MKNALIVTGGILLTMLGLFHLSFWNLFDWQEELPGLSAENSGIMQMSAVGFACLFLSLGAILINFRAEIAGTKLGRALLFALSFFFLVRTVGEFVFPGSSAGLGALLFVITFVFLVPALTNNKTAK